jgi:uncharacterized cupin superfamily protein
MPKPILNIDDVEFRAWGHNAGWPAGMNGPEKFQAKLGDIGRRLGAQKLGYNITAVPPRCQAFPLHNHRANEEMFFILVGEGELRMGGERHKLRAGDVICCPPGGVETAHQIINTSDAELRYLAVSTRISPDVGEYPESGKFGVFGEFAGSDGKPQNFRHIGRLSDSRDYWEGESGA